MNKILIVEDDPLVLFGLARALRGFGEVVNYVAYGQTALSRVNSCFYDLCFLDINLPDANGLDLMEQIGRISPETKIVIMTAGRVDSEMERKIAERAYGFIPKPFDFSHLRAIVNKALGLGGDDGLF